MNIVQTPSFKLATISKGNPDSPKLALVLPGRLDTKDYAHMVSAVDFLAAKGYFAVSFDPPGIWESPGSIELYTTTNYLKAVNEIIEHFGNRPTLLVGHSRGGTNAMLAGTANSYVTHFIAIMSHTGPTTVGLPQTDEVVKMTTRDLPPGVSRTTERKEFALPATYFQDQSQYDVTEALKSCTKPKLFFYGREDVLVSADSVIETYNLAAEPKMLQELQTEHDYRLHPEAMNEVNRVIGEFLDKYSELSPGFTQTVAIMANTPPVNNEELKRHKD
jgi:pimeloyl-ACP methyl ester carboxylesterase